jgi:phosphatidylglycerol lysyltransferase
VIAYTLMGRVALALGDPIGPSQDLNAAIASYCDLCSRNDWMPAFYQTLPDWLDCYHQAGLNSLPIGEEGIVDLAGFTLEGGANKSLRTGFHKLERLGYTTRLYPPPLSGEMIEILHSVSDEWLDTMHGSEKRFSLGWFDEDYIRSSPVIVVASPEGETVAFANLIPEYTRNEVSIDLMRHRRSALPGTMDFLFISLITWARQKGYTTFNLGLSVLAGIDEQNDAPEGELAATISRAMQFFYKHAGRFYNFEGLHFFKEKFHPGWSPRYLIYPGVTSLLAVVTALSRANSGDRLLEYL